MNASDSARMIEATKLAHQWHSGQRRKETDIPYVSHLIQVEGLILEHGGQCDQAVAGLLHDSLEDAPNPEERAIREGVIQERFGPTVFAMVLSCTDTGPDEFLEKKREWKQRKDRYIEQLSCASPQTHLVAACDKLHNLDAIVSDMRSLGPKVFERFTATPAQTLWYYTTVITLLRPSLPQRLVMELDERLDTLRKAVTSMVD